MGRSHAALVSTGAYVPEHELTNESLIARLGESSREQIEKFAASTGIVRRFLADDSVSTSALALPAAEQALARAGLSPTDLDLIVLGTDTPDYLTPATSVVLQHALGASRAGTYDVGCACASFPTALATAAGLVSLGTGIERVLVVAAYRMSRLADPKDPVSFFYGDGAGAAVLARSDTPGFLSAAFRADGRYAGDWLIESGGTVEPASHESIDAGRTRVRLVRPYPREINEEGWFILANEAAARADIGVDQIDHFLFTQVRDGTIVQVMERLGAPLERATRIMQDVGYTGSACLPMALDRAVQEGRVQVGHHVLLVGSGVGYNQAATLLRITSDLVDAQPSTKTRP